MRLGVYGRKTNRPHEALPDHGPRLQDFWQTMDTMDKQQDTMDKQHLEELNQGAAPWKVWHPAPAQAPNKADAIAAGVSA